MYIATIDVSADIRKTYLRGAVPSVTLTDIRHRVYISLFEPAQVNDDPN